MSPKRTLALALLVVLGGCTSAGTTGDSPTTAPTTESTTTTTTTTTGGSTTGPHTAVGTSHINDHFGVRASYGVDDVSVTFAPGTDDAASYDLDEGETLDLTREIHERGHAVRVVVERGDEVVFEATVRGYQSYDVTVDANDTRVTETVV